MSPRWGSPPLLLLVVCWLLVRPALGFPAGAGGASRRDLAESASGDDLISGSDFLSIFIGASLSPRSSRARNLNTRNKVGDDPDQSIGSFGARTVPRSRNTLAQSDESSSETAPRFEDLSDSNTPTVDFSFDPDNMDKKPKSGAPSRIINIPNTGIEFRSESQVSSSGRHGPSGSDTSEYFSDTSAEESSTHSKTVLTTIPSTVAEDSSLKSDSTSEVTSSESEDSITVVTDIVTSKEEVEASTEPNIIEAESQDASTKVHTILEYKTTNLQEDKPSEETSKDSELFSSIPVTTSSTTSGSTFTGQWSTSNSQFSSNPTEATKAEIQPETTRPPSLPVQVISVRVSSSVVQGPSISPYVARAKSNRIERGKTKQYHDGLTQTPESPVSDEDSIRRIETDNSVSTDQPVVVETSSAAIEPLQSPVGTTSLVTEEQPAATAVQRSQFSVEEASPAAVSTHQHVPHNFHHKTVATVVETPRNNPVSYQTSVSSATSDSRVRFYSDHPSYHRNPASVAETVQTSVVTSHRGSMQANYEQVSGEPIVGNGGDLIENRMGRYGEPHHEVRISGPSDHRRNFIPEVQQHVNPEIGRDQKGFSVRHQEPAERNYEVPEQTYGQPERKYGIPEQNYEVDEAVSVMSNGRAHGLQTTTQSSADDVFDTQHYAQHNKDPNHKFAYVTEGRNFRKYRVEERTSDGFIVGEYGVVSHDDGSLRGVRYTADGTINPRLIQEALVKFLSLQ